MTNQQQLAPIDYFKADMKRMESDIRAVLPPQIPVEKFIRTTITAVSMNPALLSADIPSLLSSTMKAAQDGLLCDGRESALVIFNTKDKDLQTGKESWIKKVQYMPMAAGLLKKMRNSGQLANLSVHVVYEKDKFTYVKGDDERIEHEPFLQGDPGEVKFAYAIAKLKDGTIQREVMTRAQIERVRNVSKAKESSPWKEWYDEMARKTVLRRISKYLPSSADLDRLLEHDNENYEPHARDMVDITPKASILENINEAIKEEKQAEAKPQPQPQPEPVSESPPADSQEFNINAYNLNTQAGLKDATKALCALLGTYPPEDRAGVFVSNSGVMIMAGLSRAGLGREKMRFTDLGIVMPQESEAA